MLLVFRIFIFAWTALALTAAAYAQDAATHYQIGDLDVMAMRDADMTMDKKLFPDLDKYPEFSGVFANGPVPAMLQTFYLKNGDRHALIDAGWGKELPVKGYSTDILRENGVKPEMITDILLTHLDHDHIGGLLENGKPVYPNAVLWVSKPEYEAWTNGNVSRGPDSVDLARKALKAYKVNQFDYGQEIMPGISSVDARGHTPGHTAFDIASGGEKMTIAGDIMHVGAIQLPRPDLSSVYDMDKSLAAESRERLLARAAEKKGLFAGMHFPMISDVRKGDGGGYLMKQPR